MLESTPEIRTLESYSKTFWDQGFVILEEYFDGELMDHYNQLVLDHYGMAPDWEHTGEFLTKAATEVVPWFPYREGNTDFDQINDDTYLNEITEAIIGTHWANLYCMCMFSKKGTKGQAWHQDCPPENPQIYNLNRLVYTHDITPESGGELCVFPGSHKMGELPAGIPDQELDGQLEFLPKKGTLVILHGHAWHKVKPIKGEYRVSINFRAVPNGVPEDVTDICVYRNMRYRFSTSEVILER